MYLSLSAIGISKKKKKKPLNRSLSTSLVSYPHPLHTTHATCYQSSSSVPLPRPCILACRALKASANPPAKLEPPELLPGVSRPLSLPILTALSLGVGVSIGCLRTAALGRFAGGAGGLGLPCLAVEVPLGG